MRAAIYCRVSGERQETDGTSLVTQEEAGRTFTADHGWTLDERHVIRETFSGLALHERPGVSQLREWVRSGEVDVIVSYALDRLSRKQTHLAILADEAERHGAKLVFVTESFEESAVGDLIRMVKAFAAETEAEKIKERTVRGMVKRIQNGRLPGKRIPFGLTWPDERDHRGRLVKARAVEDPETSWVVQRIFHEYVSGKAGRAIARDLTADGVPTPSGRSTWTNKMVNSILNRPFYKGEASVHREKTERVPGSKGRKVTPRPESEWLMLPEGTVAQIVTPAVWEAAQTQLKRNLEASPRRNPDVEDTLLRAGHVYCGLCGDALRVSRQRRRTGGPRLRYSCQAAAFYPDKCRWHGIDAPSLDQVVWAKLTAVLSESGLLRAEIERMESGTSPVNDIEALDRRIATVTKQIDSTARSVARLVDAPAAFAALEAQLRTLAKEQEELEAERALVAQRAAGWQEREELLRTLDAAAPRLALELPRYTYQQKRQLLARLAVKVSVFPKDHACRWTMRSLWDDNVILDSIRTDHAVEELFTVEENGEEYVMDRDSFLTVQARKEAASGYFAFPTSR